MVKPGISRVFVQKVKLRVDRVLEAILHGRLPFVVKDKARNFGDVVVAGEGEVLSGTPTCSGQY